jgi:hypothetical protein
MEGKETYDEELAELFELFVAGLFGMHLDAAPDERVLAHEHDGVTPRRMSWSCLEPTLSATATSTLAYSSRSWHSFLSYAIFFSALVLLIAIASRREEC